MRIPCPESVIRFEQFLREQGFVCQRADEVSEFGDFALRANKENIYVDVVVERSKWFVGFGEDQVNSLKNYEPAILRDFLGGSGEDAPSLSDQIAIIENFLPRLISMFSPDNREATHRALKRIKMERLKRRNPRLYAQVRKFVQ